MCASEAPSLRSTIACTIDSRWTTTSIRSYGMPNRWCASITSRPLFISVAESIVILPPMSQVGCASASRGADVRPARSRVSPRNGPPEAVTTSRSTVPGGSFRSSWKSAECSESTGITRAPVASRQLHHELTADHEALLVRQRDVDALAERGHRGTEPGRAHEPVQHQVGAGLGHEPHHALGAGQDLPTSPRSGRPGPPPLRRRGRSARTPNSSAWASEALPAARGRQADDLKVVAARDHVECLHADRAGRAEDHDPSSWT